MAFLVSSFLCSHHTVEMNKHTYTSLIFTIVLLLSSAAAVKHCGNCGRNPVPYPLSTAPDCGDPLYNLRCTAGTLWLDALGGSSYMIKSVNPATQRILLRPPTLTRNSCVPTDFHSEGVHLNETLPFNLTSSNTVLLFNCTNALHLPAPMNCSENSLCHSYIKDHADAATCGRVKLCCTFRTGGSYAEYVSRVHNGGCAAYQSFVDLDVTPPPPAKKWPEPGVELQWVLPHESICKGPMDCKELLNSKCLADPARAGQQRCFCDSGFKWDPINGLCQRQNVECPKHGKGKGCKVRKKKTMLIAAVAASLGAVAFIAILLWILFYKKHNQLNKQEEKTAMKRREQILSAKASGRSARIFTSREIRKATNNFSKDNIIGSGGFGEVFKARFDDGTIYAIKRAKLGNTKGVDQIINEVQILCQVNHRSLVRLLGCCVELDQPLLVYEYVSKGTLFDHLHRQSSGNKPPLSWLHRLKIALQTAEGLSYLHSSAVPPIYHRDVKSSNILLNEKLDAKVSDFGLSRFVEITEANKSHILTSAQGTLGYLDPEYYRNFQLTDKSDVYSFGVVLLELLTCQKAIDFNREEEDVNLVVYAKKVMSQERLMDIVDPWLKEGASNLALGTMKSLGYLAAACLNEQRQNRPSMKEVSDEIEYLISIVSHEVSKT